MRAALWRAARTLRVSGDRCARQSTVTCRATQLKRRELDHRDMSGPRGAFIVLEGTDRSGKSTQCARLVAALNAAGVSAESWRFPDRTTGIGHMLDAYLRGTPDGDTDDGAVHLLFSANRWEKRRVARFCLDSGFPACLRKSSVHCVWPLHRADLLLKLQAGTTLVVDRYAYSGVAFTSAKRVPGLDLVWCKARSCQQALLHHLARGT